MQKFQVCHGVGPLVYGVIDIALPRGLCPEQLIVSLCGEVSLQEIGWNLLDPTIVIHYCVNTVPLD